MAADQEDELLEAALAAQKRVEAATRASLGDGLRERMLAGALARQGTRPARTPRAGAKAIAACVASALVAGAVGFVLGTRAAPAPAVSPPPPPLRIPVPMPYPMAMPFPVPMPVPPPQPPPAPKRHSSAELDEPLLIDQARAALRRKLPDEAIAALERHEREFARGQLVEEREVLFIEAELMKGETAAARTRITGYLARFPHGLLRGYVESLTPPPPP